MSDQEATPPTQSASDERPQPKTSQPEQRGNRERGRRRHPQNNQQPSQPSSRRPEPTLNMDELRELVELIAQHGFTDFELEREGIRVRLRREVASQETASSSTSTTISQPSSPIAPAAPPPIAAVAESQSVAATTAATAETEAAKAVVPDEDLQMIPSPIVGTFYRSPSPTAEPFIRLGSHVGPDTVVCIIEAMKLMNEIQAEMSGEIVKIYVENGQPVEYGQPLFGIKK